MSLEYFERPLSEAFPPRGTAPEPQSIEHVLHGSGLDGQAGEVLATRVISIFGRLDGCPCSSPEFHALCTNETMVRSGRFGWHLSIAMLHHPLFRVWPTNAFDDNGLPGAALDCVGNGQYSLDCRACGSMWEYCNEDIALMIWISTAYRKELPSDWRAADIAGIYGSGPPDLKWSHPAYGNIAHCIGYLFRHRITPLEFESA